MDISRGGNWKEIKAPKQRIKYENMSELAKAKFEAKVWLIVFIILVLLTVGFSLLMNYKLLPATEPLFVLKLFMIILSCFIAIKALLICNLNIKSAKERKIVAERSKRERDMQRIKDLYGYRKKTKN